MAKIYIHVTIATILTIGLLHLASAQEEVRNMYIYRNIPTENRKPDHFWCRPFNYDPYVTFAAIHITENRTFDLPCYCDIFSIGEEVVAGIDILQQELPIVINEWRKQVTLEPEDWELGYRGMKIRADENSIEFITRDRNYTFVYPISIEVRGML